MANPNLVHLSGGHCRPGHPPAGPCLLVVLAARALKPQGSRLCLDQVFRRHLDRAQFPEFLGEEQLLVM